MIEIFYKENGQMMVSQSETDFAIIPKENVIWIDLFTPTGEEKRAVESDGACHIREYKLPHSRTGRI